MELNENQILIKKLTNDNNNLTKSIDQKNAELNKTKSQLQSVSGELDAIEDHRSRVDSKNSSLIDKLNSLKSQLDQLLLENQELSSALADREMKVRIMEAEKLKLINKIEEFSFEKQNLLGKLRLQEESLTAAHKLHHDTVKENLGIQNGLMEKDLTAEKLRSEIKVLTNSVQNEKNLRGQIEIANSNLEKAMNEKNQEIKVLKEDIQNLKSVLDKQNKALTKNQTESDKLKDHIMVITDQNQNLTDKINEVSEHDEVFSKSLNRKDRLYSLLEDSRKRIDASLNNIESYAKSVNLWNNRRAEIGGGRDREMMSQSRDYRMHHNQSCTLDNSGFNNY